MELTYLFAFTSDHILYNYPRGSSSSLCVCLIIIQVAMCEWQAFIRTRRVPDATDTHLIYLNFVPQPSYNVESFLPQEFKKCRVLLPQNDAHYSTICVSCLRPPQRPRHPCLSRSRDVGIPTLGQRRLLSEGLLRNSRMKRKLMT
jgi:hypothetical protein